MSGTKATENLCEVRCIVHDYQTLTEHDLSSEFSKCFWRVTAIPATEKVSMTITVNDAEESVNHPGHYGGDTAYEVIKVIEAWGLGFCLGNTVKYIARAGKKDKKKELEDLKKARWYLDREIRRLGGG